MDIELLETFIDLMETRSFNGTAERTGLSQSAVSHRIQRLEAAVDRRLFMRNRSGVAPTAAGLRFHDHALALRRRWRESVRQVRTAEAHDSTLRVGLQFDIADLVASAVFEKLRGDLPTVVLAFEVDYSVQMIADVMAGELDVALVFTPRFMPDLHIEEAGALPYLMVSGGSTARDAYCIPNISPVFRRLHDARHPDLGQARASCGQSRAIVEMIGVTGGASYVSAPMAERLAATGRVTPVPEVAPLLQPVYIAVALRNRHLPAHARAMRVMRKAMEALAVTRQG